ncbi:BadF/BadG/BcrA/BcrD ATPase family protein [soil metagenome]
MSEPLRLLLAVDGGGTKTDVAVVGIDGMLLARRLGPHVVPQVLGVAASLEAVFALAAAACVDAGVDPARLRTLAGAVFHLAGIDLPVEQTAYLAAARNRCAGRVHVDNDALAVLHAGFSDGHGVAVVCGTGANVVAVDRGGEVSRYRALGDITGDCAGGFLLGRAALFHAARSADGRGPCTQLEQRVPQWFGLATPEAVADALHLGDLRHTELSDLAPAVLAAARDHDAVAGRLIDDLTDELVRMVVALIARLPAFDGREIPVVLGGGILQAGDSRLTSRFATMLRRSLPRARVRILDRPPVAGSGAAALRLVEASAQALSTFDRAAWRPPAPSDGE